MRTHDVPSAGTRSEGDRPEGMSSAAGSAARRAGGRTAANGSQTGDAGSLWPTVRDRSRPQPSTDPTVTGVVSSSRDLHLQSLAGFRVSQRAEQVLDALDRLLAEADDHVSGAQPGAAAGPPGPTARTNAPCSAGSPGRLRISGVIRPGVRARYGSGGRPHVVCTGVAEWSQVERLTRRAVERERGRAVRSLDTWVRCAATGVYDPAAGRRLAEEGGRRKASGGNGRRRRGYRPSMANSRLVRPQSEKWIAGVCAGLADRFGLSRGLVRILFVVFGLVGAGEVAYIVLWILMPKAG